MAPNLRDPSKSLRVQISSSSLSPLFPSPTFLEPTSPSTNTPSSTNHPSSPNSFSPRALYADSFNRRPLSPNCLPTPRYRKNVKEMTGWATTEEEFDALPMAVRRKYFSTLERLRFAQNSRTTALNELPLQSQYRPSIADRRGLTLPDIKSHHRRKRSYSASGVRKGRPTVSSNDASWFLTLPEKIKQKEFTREEQVILAGRLRESVILDAADEAIYKTSRRASRNLAPLFGPSLTSTPRTSSDSRRRDSCSSMADIMYESFRWMDEEEDINLKLVLDDYHANLDGVVLPTPGSAIRPSFRRQLSISKMPFGRNSLSSIPPLSPKNESSHYRSKSRALSLITPRHMPQASVSSIDPHATHYQDPEARLKLRVYLASPQKFDEAIEFGFPSLDGVTDGDKENLPAKSMQRDANAVKKSFATEKSFLADDMASLFEDDTSMIDPDSPLTPMHPEFRPQQQKPALVYPLSKYNKTPTDAAVNPFPRSPMKHTEYSQAMAGSREMTLRMTLTRPDLRADESQLYGWQSCNNHQRDASLAIDLDEKDEVRGPFGGHDGWGRPEKESTGIKKLWHKVKHPGVQRRIS